MNDQPRFGIMLSQTWPNSRSSEGESFTGLRRALDTGYFDHFQMVDVPYPSERRMIHDLLAGTSHSLTYCATRKIGEAGLSLSSLDDAVRHDAVDLATACIDEANETGAGIASFISGPRPGLEADRTSALDRFAESVAALCSYSDGVDGPAVAIEALDYSAHKRMTLGTVEETCRIVDSVSHPRLCTCVDLAHLLLNGESVDHALERLGDTMVEFHFGNVVMEPDQPLYGDNHIRFGPPGCVDDRTVSEVARRLDRSGFLRTAQAATGRTPAVMCEVLAGASGESVGTLSYVATRLRLAWEQ